MAKKKNVRFEDKTLPEKKLEFRRHFRTYLVMSLFFVGLNYYMFGSFGWAFWPILGWGIGVAMQGLSLYGPLRDPDDAHPRADDPYTTDDDFSGPLPDLRDRQRETLERRPYRDEDLV